MNTFFIIVIATFSHTSRRS